MRVSHIHNKSKRWGRRNEPTLRIKGQTKFNRHHRNSKKNACKSKRVDSTEHGDEGQQLTSGLRVPARAFGPITSRLWQRTAAIRRVRIANHIRRVLGVFWWTGARTTMGVQNKHKHTDDGTHTLYTHTPHYQYRNTNTQVSHTRHTHTHTTLRIQKQTRTQHTAHTYGTLTVFGGCSGRRAGGGRACAGVRCGRP